MYIKDRDEYTKCLALHDIVIMRIANCKIFG